jgi:hypothetical protein
MDIKIGLSHRRKWAEGLRERSREEDIWAQVGGSKKRLKETA